MHHAAVDGASGMEVTAAIHDLERRPLESKPLEWEWPATKEPGVLSALLMKARAQINTLRQPLRFISVARNTVPGFARKPSWPCVNRGQASSASPRCRGPASTTAYRPTACSRAMSRVVWTDIKAIKNAVEGAPRSTTWRSPSSAEPCAATCRTPARNCPPSPSWPWRRSTCATPRKRAAVAISSRRWPSRVYSEVEDPAKRASQAVSIAARTRRRSYTHAIGAKSMTDYAQFIPSTLTAQAARLASALAPGQPDQPLLQLRDYERARAPGTPLHQWREDARAHSSVG
jgi:diacylglycerol O-acyltransferase